MALVTGGDSGIGRAVAILFAREGADVAITYLPEEKSDALETIQGIEEEGRSALSIAGDIQYPEFSRRAVRQTIAKLGKLDILVNNAATSNIRKLSRTSPRSSGIAPLKQTSTATFEWPGRRCHI